MLHSYFPEILSVYFLLHVNKTTASAMQILNPVIQGLNLSSYHTAFLRQGRKTLIEKMQENANCDKGNRMGYVISLFVNQSIN